MLAYDLMPLATQQVPTATTAVCLCSKANPDISINGTM